ncbi:MAG TPA: twin transmembrane helix small protein [Candidatus Polarisedimenticolia bacterium]|nr:twin transmembrane helix small protein [Candidatus Polarisedimenticolia bacterium]
MDKVVFAAIIVFMVVTLAILLTGLFSMAKGGDFNKRNANRFMRWHVIAQGIAILLFIIFMMTWHRA